MTEEYVYTIEEVKRILDGQIASREFTNMMVNWLENEIDSPESIEKEDDDRPYYDEMSGTLHLISWTHSDVDVTVDLGIVVEGDETLFGIDVISESYLFHAYGAESLQEAANIIEVILHMANHSPSSYKTDP